MSIIPTGRPAWSRTADIESYGGNVNKQNYLGGGVIDATTDVGAEDFCRLTADLAAVTRTAPAMVIVFDNNDSSPAAPTIVSVRMMTGVTLVPYAGGSAPSGFPTAARNGAGDVTFTFASSYTDEYGVADTFEVTDADATGHGSAFCSVSVEIVTATTVRVRCFNDAGAALSNARVTLVIG